MPTRPKDDQDARRAHAPAGDPLAPPVSDASRRLRALASLSGSLTDALAPEDAARIVEKEALTALGATSAVVVTLGPFPPPVPSTVAPLGVYTPPAAATLHVVHAIGLPAEIAATLEQLPLQAEVPLAQVARDAQPLFLDNDAALLRYPDWGPAMIAAGACSAAIVPVWANGELRGVLGLAWGERHEFDEDERAFVLTLGIMCAQAILRAHLKKAELEARAAAEHANLAKSLFVANISHELRTPINAVLGYTQLLSEGIDGEVSPRQQVHLGRVRASGKHLLGLVEDLLGFARLDAGEEIVRPEPTPLADIVDEAVALVAPLADAKGTRVEVRQVASVVMQTDARKLLQVLVNVLANAVKYTDGGTVVLVSRVDGTDDDPRVHCEITDSGRGIAAKHHEHVFDPFWQAESGTTQRSGSTGLGLSVARQLARLLQGDVILTRSALGEGSTFDIQVPLTYVAR